MSRRCSENVPLCIYKLRGRLLSLSGEIHGEIRENSPIYSI